ncbi:hypothetical protein GPA21_02360 [Azoarcus taiwanensis]|uniref:Uncharacterized protein n=1 Tax=Azoarcus taiwanensis TaxID=666964 RepID=A0A972FAR2_9RHOO|nr:hypothetical protein [Azoarcus taiwanensis]
MISKAVSQKDGNAFDLDGSIGDVFANPSRGRVIQERLFDHPRLFCLNGLRGPQAMRVNTLPSEGSVVEVLNSFVRSRATRSTTS